MLGLADDKVRVVTGVFDGSRDHFRIKKYLPTNGSVSLTNPTMDVSTPGLWGAKAPAITDADLDQTAPPYGSIRDITVRTADGDVAVSESEPGPVKSLSLEVVSFSKQPRNNGDGAAIVQESPGTA
jgi:glycine cleavage system aminomethyltransferase T